MTIHKNARLTPYRRGELVSRITAGERIIEVARQRTAYKWIVRYRVEGPAGLADRTRSAALEPPPDRRRDRTGDEGVPAMSTCITGSVGNTCTSESTITLASPTSRSCRTRARGALGHSCALRWFRMQGVHVRRILTDNGSAYRSDSFRATCRALRVIHRARAPTRHARTVKPSASFRPPCANGLTGGRTTAQPIVPACCRAGWSTTIARARMRVSMGGLP
jgi:hypothetical protein